MMRTFCLLLTAVLAAGSARAEEVYVVQIHGVIEQGVAAYVTRVMSEAKDNDAAAVVFEINTPGGALDAALTIRDAILYSDVNTIAFVNPRAISAGSLIALSTKHIVMIDGGTIGAATAVDLQGHKASEKVISYFRNEMKATAEKTGRPPKLAEAMVDEDVDVEGLAPKGKLLTLTTDAALANGVAEHRVSGNSEGENLHTVLAFYGLENARIERQSVTWSEQVVRWLTYPYVASALMTLGFLGLLFELFSPGWGLGGTLGLICLGLFFGSHWLVDLAGWTEVLMFLLGAVLVVLDIFFIAGFGILGIPGIVLMLASIFLTLMGRVELWTWDSVSGALTPLLLSVVVTGGAAIYFLRTLPESWIGRRIVLETDEKASAGYRVLEYEELLGAHGMALTSLRPSGTGEFNGRRVSVATEGDFVDKGTPITVVAVEGSRVVVRHSDGA